MCNFRWHEKIQCVCYAMRAEECRHCVADLSGEDPTKFIILQDRNCALHVHWRVPMAQLDQDQWMNVLFYEYKRQGQHRFGQPTYVANLYAGYIGTNELGLVEGNLPANNWLVLMPFGDGSKLWITPGMVFEWNNQGTANRVLLALANEKTKGERVQKLEMEKNDLLTLINTFYEAFGPVFFGLTKGRRLSKATTKALLGLDWLLGERVWKIDEILTTKPREHLRTFAEWLKSMRDSEEWRRVLKVAKQFDLLDEHGQPKVEK